MLHQRERYDINRFSFCLHSVIRHRGVVDRLLIRREKVGFGVYPSVLIGWDWNYDVIGRSVRGTVGQKLIRHHTKIFIRGRSDDGIQSVALSPKNNSSPAWNFPVSSCAASFF
jgi:hypothetical protein